MTLFSWFRGTKFSQPDRPSHRRRHLPRRRTDGVRLSLEALEDRCLLSAGQLDPAFGSAGEVFTNLLGPPNSPFNAMTVSQPDGKIVLVSPNSGEFVVRRLNPDGSPDTTFGTDGLATLADPGLESPLAAVAVDATGRILVVGQDNYLGFAVGRLEPNGTPDPTFGTGGLATLSYGKAVGIYPSGLAVDAAGRIVLTGSVSGNGIRKLQKTCSLSALCALSQRGLTAKRANRPCFSCLDVN